MQDNSSKITFIKKRLRKNIRKLANEWSLAIGEPIGRETIRKKKIKNLNYGFYKVGYICKPKINIFIRMFHMPAKSKIIANKNTKTKKIVMGKSATISGTLSFLVMNQDFNCI